MIDDKMTIIVIETNFIQTLNSYPINIILIYVFASWDI